MLHAIPSPPSRGPASGVGRGGVVAGEARRARAARRWVVQGRGSGEQQRKEEHAPSRPSHFSPPSPPTLLPLPPSLSLFFLPHPLTPLPSPPSSPSSFSLHPSFPLRCFPFLPSDPHGPQHGAHRRKRPRRDAPFQIFQSVLSPPMPMRCTAGSEQAAGARSSAPPPIPVSERALRFRAKILATPLTSNRGCAVTIFRQPRLFF